MAVKFEAVLKNNGIGGWCIELTDTLESTTVRCEDLENFSSKIQEMGEGYGNDIEVEWSSADDVSPAHMQELRVAMMEYQEKYQEEIDKELNGDQTPGFDPNAN